MSGTKDVFKVQKTRKRGTLVSQIRSSDEQSQAPCQKSLNLQSHASIVTINTCSLAQKTD